MFDKFTTHGRTYEKEGRLYFNWTYSGFSFAFSGTAAQAVLYSDENSNAYVNVYVDSSKEPTDTLILSAGENTYSLVQGLADGEHVVTLRKRTENRGHATAAVKEVTVTGKLLSAPCRPAKTVEVIGDSITCGYGNLVDGNSMPHYRAMDQDGTRTYAALALQRFSEDVTMICKSGIGFAYNNGGGTTDTMKEVYGCTDYFQLGTEPKWDFAAHPKELVIIALGTNDTCAPGEGAYYEGAKAFYGQVREANPQAIIIWVYEILTASYNHCIRRVVEEAQTAGDKKVHYYALGLMDIEKDGVGAAGHPSLATHQKDAAGFADFIAGVTGWEG